MKIHPTAIIHKSAKLADDVKVGPYAIIEKDVVIGKNTRIGPHCFIGPFTEIGKDNDIFTGAIIGSHAQDLKFKGWRSFLEIGDENIIREYVTINRSAGKDEKTKVGNNNLLMAYSHIAHDCVIGDGVIIANCGTLGGHVIVEDNVIIGGLAGVHQFARIGKLSIIGGHSKVVQDIPPYCMADGHPAVVKGANIIGLRRAHFASGKINSIKKAVKILFFSEFSTSSAIKHIKEEIPPSDEIKDIVCFIENSKRGLSK